LFLLFERAQMAEEEAKSFEVRARELEEVGLRIFLIC
jgi:hypothetical protein